MKISLRCLSVFFYIKPQQDKQNGSVFNVVYQSFSTSNHNFLIFSV